MNLRTNRKAWAMLAFAGLLVALGIAYSPRTGQNELHEVRHSLECGSSW